MKFETTMLHSQEFEKFVFTTANTIRKSLHEFSKLVRDAIEQYPVYVAFKKQNEWELKRRKKLRKGKRW